MNTTHVIKRVSNALYTVHKTQLGWKILTLYGGD